MIGQLDGKISFVGANFVIIKACGVGYKVSVSTNTLLKLSKEDVDSVPVWTYLAVRENALDLYGFIEHSELKAFEMLITISGIGPKSALGILSVATIDMLRSAVSSGDSSHLTKVSGIGKKMAEKIIIELRDKLGALEGDEGESNELKEESETIEALEALGYSTKDAREALKKTDDSAITTEEKVKQALKNLL